MYIEDKGAYTGEISADMLLEHWNQFNHYRSLREKTDFQRR